MKGLRHCKHTAHFFVTRTQHFFENVLKRATQVFYCNASLEAGPLQSDVSYVKLRDRYSIQALLIHRQTYVFSVCCITSSRPMQAVFLSFTSFSFLFFVAGVHGLTTVSAIINARGSPGCMEFYCEHMRDLVCIIAMQLLVSGAVQSAAARPGVCLRYAVAGEWNFNVSMCDLVCVFAMQLLVSGI